ncbi:tyrosine-type recombinase/integrase [Alcaligenes endophyticus]|uniref:Tyrosine-type recombinase/integrase n=1 Tax=Alcaligenes endophyticus TaxID=1929088 RepID=A0ABT8EJJ0_9BURK|nr:tyrosine-type recombinase/integrase [Alcaligenes endophyticus]MCX5591779.1 tyrosine-type recombinase/integrase [Alcaligenes endophyticus]MDN4121456.1 tyrosine-type recombinase/integrase [Alcaligenes endophyticus]
MSSALLPSWDASFELSPNLDGSTGRNRATSSIKQIGAQTDVQAVQAWLNRYTHSPRTYASYSKEVERLLLWAIMERRTPLSSLQHEDLQAYQHFLANPQPAQRWVTQAGKRPARNSPAWRPFVGPLSSSSQRQAMLIVNALFAWLVQAGYLVSNPLALAPKRLRVTGPTERYLSPDLWHHLQRYVLSMSTQTPSQLRAQSRARWLLSVLYGCGLRVSELIQAQMSDVYSRINSQGQTQWWLRVTGKGNKLRQVPVSTELLSELQHYRLTHQLPPLPLPMENRPLLMPVGGGIKPITRAAVHTSIKQLAKAAAHALRQQDPNQEAQAHQLEQMSAHWLRHTAGSHMANQGVDIRIIRDTLGHASISTSNIYLHTEAEQRHQALEQYHRLDWN